MDALLSVPMFADIDLEEELVKSEYSLVSIMSPWRITSSSMYVHDHHANVDFLRV